MTTIDDSLIVKGLLDDNWDAANVPLPVIYYDDSIKNHDYRKDAVKIYVRSGPLRKAIDVGYNNYKVHTGITIDFRTSNRDRMLALRDEVNRCLGLSAVRKAPNSNYSVLLFDSERQVTGYAGFWHYVIEITLSGRRAF